MPCQDGLSVLQDQLHFAREKRKELPAIGRMQALQPPWGLGLSPPCPNRAWPERRVRACLACLFFLSLRNRTVQPSGLASLENMAMSYLYMACLGALVAHAGASSCISFQGCDGGVANFPQMWSMSPHRSRACMNSAAEHAVRSSGEHEQFKERCYQSQAARSHEIFPFSDDCGLTLDSSWQISFGCVAMPAIPHRRTDWCIIPSGENRQTSHPCSSVHWKWAIAIYVYQVKPARLTHGISAAAAGMNLRGSAFVPSSLPCKPSTAMMWVFIHVFLRSHISCALHTCLAQCFGHELVQCMLRMFYCPVFFSLHMSIAQSAYHGLLCLPIAGLEGGLTWSGISWSTGVACKISPTMPESFLEFPSELLTKGSRPWSRWPCSIHIYSDPCFETGEKRLSSSPSQQQQHYNGVTKNGCTWNATSCKWVIYVCIRTTCSRIPCIHALANHRLMLSTRLLLRPTKSRRPRSLKRELPATWDFPHHYTPSILIQW